MSSGESKTGLVAVVGGTGRVGSSVVEALRQDGIPVRVLTRSPEKRERLPGGVDGHVGDPHDTATLKKLMADAQGVFFVSLHDEQEEQVGRGIIAEAQKASVRKLVYASAAYPNPKNKLARKVAWTMIGLMSPHYRPKMRLDATVRKLPIGIVLMPANFFQNDEVYRHDLMEEGVYPQPIGKKGASRIDTRDIGDAAVRVFREDRHVGGVYPIVGPTMNGEQCAAVWSEALARPVRYAGDDLDAWEHRIEDRLSQKERQDFRKTYKLMQKVGFGAPARAQAECEALLQKPLRGYLDYAREVALKWKSG
jgi:uncharacterized protein YbjT (DUF2867 family)